MINFIKKLFNTLILMIALIGIRIFEFIIKIISIKGFIFISVFYLYLYSDNKSLDIYGLIILAGWLAEIRRKEKNNTNKLSLNKESILEWVDTLKDKYISKNNNKKEAS